MKDDIKLLHLIKYLKGNIIFVSFVYQDIGIIHFTHNYMNQFNEFYWEKIQEYYENNIPCTDDTNLYILHLFLKEYFKNKHEK